MRLKLLDIILLLVIAIGGFLALRSAQEHFLLRQEYTRLVQITGDLPIGDSKKLHLRAIDTRDPMNYALRVYLPPNFKWELRSISGNSSSSGSTRSRDFIARVRFRVDEQGVLQVYTHFLDGSSVTRLGDEPRTATNSRSVSRSRRISPSSCFVADLGGTRSFRSARAKGFSSGSSRWQSPTPIRNLGCRSCRHFARVSRIHSYNSGIA
jgi:hypothetical protein